ncbi:MAG: hypothetical protein RLZZ241_1845 [Bacteroidota bacterium]
MLIAAAFIGPGTVTTCLRSGIQDGYSLLWALLLSIVATIVLQEMAGRLGIITGQGLPQLIRNHIQKPILVIVFIGVILAAIVLGNGAYEAGNLAGAALGLEAIFGKHFSAFYPWISGLLAIVLLSLGSYRLLERIFTMLVLIMSGSFALTAVLLNANWEAVLQGLFVPGLNSHSLLNVMALIGTTVVPYNLFLYAALVTQKWKGPEDVKLMRRDIILSVVVGGLVSMAILITGAGSGMQTLTTIMDLTVALEPVYGSLARYGLGIGLFAAGITSAITAPMAAAYVAKQCFGWSGSHGDFRFRLVWLLIIFAGLGSHLFNYRPLQVIYFAQIANALVLPVIALFLFWALQSKRVMGNQSNNLFQRLLAGVVIVLVTGLAIRTLIGIWN